MELDIGRARRAYAVYAVWLARHNKAKTKMICYDYDESSNIINACVEGVLTKNDIVDYFHQLVADDSIKPHATERVLFTDTKNIDVQYDETTGIREEYRRVKSARHIDRTIFIVDNDMTYGMARMFATVVSEIPHEFSIERTPLENA